MGIVHPIGEQSFFEPPAAVWQEPSGEYTGDLL